MTVERKSIKINGNVHEALSQVKQEFEEFFECKISWSKFLAMSVNHLKSLARELKSPPL